MRYKHQHKGYVWCDFHGEIHPKKEDYYQESEYFNGCIPENWRRVWIETDNKDEWWGQR
jgi:hypothetical protein